MLKVSCLDAFSGIGGISLALKPYVETILYCEINGYCQSVLIERMKNGDLEKAPIHSDVKTLYISPKMNVEMICAGSPCQDISQQGIQQGIKQGTRSGLFFELMRLVDENPSIQVLFLENVANITKCGMKEVVTELNSRGFQFCWKMVSASSKGAPHQRMRWFCLAIKPGFDVTKFEIQSNTISEDHWCNEPKKRFVYKPNFQVDPDYDPNWVQRSQALGNSVVPCAVRQAFCDLVRLHKNSSGIFNCFEEFSRTVESLDYPFSDTGMISNGKFYALPDFTPLTKNNGKPVQVNLNYHGKKLTFDRLPTPRHGLSHPSSLTERSMKDLPTLLVYCDQTKEQLDSTISNSDKLHTFVLPNIQYIEWMMGYPKDWTKTSFFNKKPIKHPEITITPPDDVSIAETSNTAATTKRRFGFNAMHAFLKEQKGKSVTEVAKLWRELDQDKKAHYKTLASKMNGSN